MSLCAEQSLCAKQHLQSIFHFLAVQGASQDSDAAQQPARRAKRQPGSPSKAASAAAAAPSGETGHEAVVKQLQQRGQEAQELATQKVGTRSPARYLASSGREHTGMLPGCALSGGVKTPPLRGCSFCSLAGCVLITIKACVV